METNYLILKKQRDFGEIITDTFQFIKQNFKTLFTLILKTTWPALLFALLVLGFYFYTFQDFSYLSYMSPSDNPLLIDQIFPAGFLLVSFVLLVAVSVFYALLNGTVLGIMKSYANNQGEILENEVQDEVRAKFWNLWGGGVLAGIMIFIGFMLCLIPGIYLFVPLSLIYAIIIFQNKSISDALSECFYLIKDNWWITFATFLVIGILYYIINFIVQIPLMIYMLAEMFVANPDGVADPNLVFDWLLIALNLFFTVLQYLISSIMIVAAGFIYYNLNEQKHSTGTFEKIEGLGKE